MGLSRRTFMREMKLAAAQRRENVPPLPRWLRAFEVNPNVLHRWRREFRQGQGTLFRVWESAAGMTRSKPSWNERSANRPWRSIL